jgi:hypothetical protein
MGEKKRREVFRSGGMQPVSTVVDGKFAKAVDLVQRGLI